VRNFSLQLYLQKKNIREAHDDKRARNHMTRDVNKARRKGMFCLCGSKQNGTNTSRTEKEKEEKGKIDFLAHIFSVCFIVDF
jgi:hypothetical protein